MDLTMCARQACLAFHMFRRQAESYDAAPHAIAEWWLDPDIQAFWLQEAGYVIAFLTDEAA